MTHFVSSLAFLAFPMNTNCQLLASSISLLQQVVSLMHYSIQ